MTTVEQIRDMAAKGVGRRGVEAMIGHDFTPEELVEYRKAVAGRQMKIAERKAGGPKSSAERVREHVARANDIPEFNIKPRHPRLKEKCKFDLEAFGWYYCRRVLKHRASDTVKSTLIKDVQNAILNGGKFVEECGRGIGKTTWICYIAIVWAILYGHRRYPIIISATGKLAKKNLKTIKRLLTRSKAIMQDFPEAAIPLEFIGDVSQRTASVTYRGYPVDMEWSSDQIKLAMLRDDKGNPIAPCCGAIVGSVGIGGAVRGANEEGQRPDFIIFDDPQTRKIAHSPRMTEEVIRYIHEDALLLAGHDRQLSAFVAITPQCYGDVATELTSQSKHPEWAVNIQPFITRLCPKWAELAEEFADVYSEDAANHDTLFTRSRDWYVENQDKFAGIQLIDWKQFDVDTEVDAIHHVLNLRASLGDQAFNAELLMQVGDIDSELSITADRVAGCLNGAPRGTLPVGTDSAVAFCDVNIQRSKGLSWAIVGFGPKRVAAVVAYGRYPERGALVPPNSSDYVRNRLVAQAIRTVIDKVKSIRLRDSYGRAVNLTAFGFDRGYLPDVVHRTLRVVRATQPVPFQLVAVRGFPWNKFGTRKADMLRRGDHVFATRSQYGQYLAEMAPYWREKMQSGFLETPLMPGSCSLYGSDPVRHYDFANQIASERLVRKYTVDRAGRTETAWDWSVTGENHFCDVLTGAFAVASWFHLYDNLAKVIDKSVIVTPSGLVLKTVAGMKAAAAAGETEITQHVVHQDDLFDPSKNPSIVENADYQPEDDTEGTLDHDVAPYAGHVESTSDPLVDASREVPPARVINTLSTHCKRKVHKFRRGKWKR